MIGYIRGFLANDDISIANSTTYAAKNVNFLAVYEKIDLHLYADGLLGLSPHGEKTN